MPSWINVWHLSGFVYNLAAIIVCLLGVGCKENRSTYFDMGVGDVSK